MTQKDKELLLKDLSSRLPYGVKVHCKWNLFQGSRISEDGELVSIKTYAKSIHFKRNSGRITEIPFNRIDGTVLPYLRPMSSMTEEEKEELKQEHFKDERLFAECLTKMKNGDSSMRGKVIPHFASDWCNKNHFDYRGLIEKGLAIEAPEGMYNIKGK